MSPDSCTMLTVAALGVVIGSRFTTRNRERFPLCTDIRFQAPRFCMLMSRYCKYAVSTKTIHLHTAASLAQFVSRSERGERRISRKGDVFCYHSKGATLKSGRKENSVSASVSPVNLRGLWGFRSRPCARGGLGQNAVWVKHLQAQASL